MLGQVVHFSTSSPETTIKVFQIPKGYLVPPFISIFSYRSWMMKNGATAVTFPPYSKQRL
jgi:hypothetical protein